MATKYSVSSRDRWAHEHDVRLSDHAAERWDQRAPTDAVAPETAWERGVAVPEAGIEMLDSDGDTRPERARCYRTCDDRVLVLVVAHAHSPAIVTVYRGCRMAAAERAYFDALADQVEGGAS